MDLSTGGQGRVVIPLLGFGAFLVATGEGEGEGGPARGTEGCLPSITAGWRGGIGIALDQESWGSLEAAAFRQGLSPEVVEKGAAAENLLELSSVHVLPLLKNCSEGSPGVVMRLGP